MNINKFFLILAGLFCAYTTIAQQDPNYTFYRYNMNLVNPAFAGASGSEIALSIRSQWASVEGAPETQGVFLSHEIGKSVGLGISIINDKTFVESQTSMALDFSYKLKFGASTFLYLGLKGAVNSYDVNLEGLETSSATTDPSLSDIDGGFNPNIGVGALLKGAKYFISLSTPRLLSPERLEDVNGTVKLGEDRMHMYAAGGYDFSLGTDFVLKPSVMLRYVDASPISVDLTAILSIYQRAEIGLAYRLDEGISGLLLFNASSKLKIGYAYESAFESLIQNVGNGTHEIFIKIGL
ncbi:MAG: type IX secretion system membrane protein PorP/SprF [Cellulophaga sp.]